MNEKAKKELQDFIDRSYELAQKHVAKAEAEGRTKPNLVDTFCYFICWDLAREVGLDLKGAIPE